MVDLHLIVSKRALQPLDNVKEVLVRVVQVHREADQVQARGALQAIHEASFDTFLKLIASEGGLQNA